MSPFAPFDSLKNASPNNRDKRVSPSASRGKSGDQGISQTRAYNPLQLIVTRYNPPGRPLAPTYVTRYKARYCPTSFVGQSIHFPDFPRFADAQVIADYCMLDDKWGPVSLACTCRASEEQALSTLWSERYQWSLRTLIKNTLPPGFSPPSKPLPQVRWV